LYATIYVMNRKIRGYVLLILIIANIFIWTFVFSLRTASILIVTFLDVGQGDATLTMWTQYIHTSSVLGSLI